MENIIKFFITKVRLNYTIFILLIIFGVSSYINLPKDVFPVIRINKIIVSGGYAGSSISILDKMVVSDLEKEFKSISGVEEIETTIKNGTFKIIIDLFKGIDQNNILDKVKDIIALNSVDLPSDMNDPTAIILDLSFPLIDITLSSNTTSKDKLIRLASDIKDQISGIDNISQVILNESDETVVEIILDDKKIELYNLDKNTLFSKIKQLSFIYPIGKIEDKKEHLYLSTENGNKKIEEYLNTSLKIGNKIIFLGDIASIKKNFKEIYIISKLNGKFNINISTFKSVSGDAMILTKKIKDKIIKLNKKYPDIEIDTFHDTSVLIKNRLNTVFSNILMGLILLTIAMYILINKRVAFIILIGIPTALLIGLVVLSFTEYSINMITLIGVLLILGVLVDDAVIIAENVQRHIMMGEDKLQATITGTKEVILPVLASSITTLFAFLPMTLLTGIMGEFLLMIPIAISILVVASLIESFIFLPVHSLHILNSNNKELDWSKFQNLYSKFLYFAIRNRKKIISLFIIGIPSLTFFLIGIMNFQLFPDFDGDNIYIKGRLTVDNTYIQTYNQTKGIEDVLLKYKKELFIKKMSYTVGTRKNDKKTNEIKQSVFQFSIELFSKKPENILEEYIVPILSAVENDNPKIRTLSSLEIIAKIKKLIEKVKPDNLEDFGIKKDSAGVIKNDIEIEVNTKDKNLLIKAIKEIEKEIKNIKGVISTSNTATLGVRDLKIKLNEYGESLGFNENIIASNLSPMFLKIEQTKGLDKDGVFKIISYGRDKDNFSSFSNFEINIPETQQKIFLNEICDFVYIDNFDESTKKNQKEIKEILANVNNEIITSTEILEKIKPTLDEYRKQGLSISFGGERKEKERTGGELKILSIIAICLMFLTLLIMFDSFVITIIILSIIPLSALGAILGHLILNLNLTIPSMIGLLGLAGVVINNAIIMLDFIRFSKTIDDIISRAKLRLRPIIITSITTFLGLSTLIFFADGQSKILQPIAISLGFGLIWGTILTLIYIPLLFSITNKISFKSKNEKF